MNTIILHTNRFVKVSGMKKLLIVVDMLNGFLHPGVPLYCGDDARKIIPFVKNLLEEYMQKKDTVIFLADSHAPDDAEFAMFPPHCVKGSQEARVIEELSTYAEAAIIIEKTRYSGFYGTDLEAVLVEHRPDIVEVVGVCTNICVLYTVEGLRNRDLKVRVYKKGVASFDRKAHVFALQQMQTVLGAEIVE